MRARGFALSVVVLVLVGGGAVLADGAFRGRAEDRLAADLQAELGGLDAPPEVTIEGFPFLTQVVAGRLEEVRVSAAEAVVEDLTLRDIDVRLWGVSTDSPTTAEHARLEGSLPLGGIRDLLPVDVDLAVHGDALVGSATLLGLPVEAVLRPTAAGREIRVGIEELRLGGAVVSVDDLPAGVIAGLDGLAVPIDQLPRGLELTDLVVAAEGLRITAEGSDVVLETAS